MRRGLLARWLRGRPAEAGEPVPDADLLARFAGGRDEAAFELLVWRHAALVLGVCRRVVRDDHLAEDAFQAVFLVLARKAGSVRGANLAGWLFRVAWRVAARARRQAEARAKRETPLAVEPEVAPLPCPAEDREFLAVLDEEVARLPERFRRPVLLCYLGGRTTEDAARVLGCPRGTVLSRLATARQRLASRLTRRGVALPAGVLGTVAVPSVSGVVPPTVRASLLFLTTASRLSPSNPVLLANGALTAMTLGKTLTVGAVLVLTAAGLLGGSALLSGPGHEAVALAADPPGAEPPKASEPPSKAEPPTSAEVDPLAERREAVRRQLSELDAAADAHRRSIDDLQQQADRLRSVLVPVNQESQAGELDRELLVEEVRELATVERSARQAHAKMAAVASGAGATGGAALERLAADHKHAAAALEKAKQALKKHDGMEADRSRVLYQAVERERAKLGQVTLAMESKLAALARIEAERERLDLRMRGVELPAAGGGDQLGELLKEVRELLKEVRELREQKQK